MAVTTHQQRAPRVSEGTSSAQEINRHATRNAMPSPYLLDTRPAGAHKAAHRAALKARRVKQHRMRAKNA